MTTCITCLHWQPKQTDPKMARMGFAQCDTKPKGHSYSAHATACDRHRPVTDEIAKVRKDWLAAIEQEKKR